MPRRTISLKQETYTRLAEAKGEDDSFSDVIDRLLGVQDKDNPLDELVGLCDPDDVARLRARSRSVRDDVNYRMRPAP